MVLLFPKVLLPLDLTSQTAFGESMGPQTNGLFVLFRLLLMVIGLLRKFGIKVVQSTHLAFLSISLNMSMVRLVEQKLSKRVMI